MLAKHAERNQAEIAALREELRQLRAAAEGEGEGEDEVGESEVRGPRLSFGLEALKGAAKVSGLLRRFQMDGASAAAPAAASGRQED